jgi:hypothetical protein
MKKSAAGDNIHEVTNLWEGSKVPRYGASRRAPTAMSKVAWGAAQRLSYALYRIGRSEENSMWFKETVGGRCAVTSQD